MGKQLYVVHEFLSRALGDAMRAIDMPLQPWLVASRLSMTFPIGRNHGIGNLAAEKALPSAKTA